MATLTDSIKPASRYLSKKSKIPSGHLHKGHNKIAASASIPSKYQTIVISNEERKGFHSGSKRFSDYRFTEGPGPANYSVTKSLTQDNHVSHSKKGLGGFVSKVKRFPQSWNEGYSVGPGQYSPGTSSLNQDFNKASCTSNFHKPIAVATDSKKFQTPAPNQYQLSNKLSGRTTRENHVGACAAFSSKTKRDFLSRLPQASVPAPGSYNFVDPWSVDDGNVRGAQAPFKSTTERTFGQLKTSFEMPGPGTYNPYNKLSAGGDRRAFPRKHYLCISAPAIPMPPEPDAPGPGQYDLVNYEGPEREYGSSSMFLSTTNRWIPRQNGSAPGPGAYNPHQFGKMSFLYNADKKWI